MSAEAATTAGPRIVVVDTLLYLSQSARSLALLRQFHDMCAKEFDPNELETLPDWEASLQRTPGVPLEQFPAHQLELDFFGVFVLMTATLPDSDREIVVGGVALEVYPRQAIALLAYVVVASSMRGKGLSRVLVDFCREWIARRFASVAPAATAFKPTLVIEVLQVRDAVSEADKKMVSERGDDESAAAQVAEKIAGASSRQAVWAKMGFMPLRGVNLVHPGRLKGGRYNIAISCADASDGAVVGVPREQLNSWLDLFFRLIIEDSRDEEDEEEEEEAEDERSERETAVAEAKRLVSELQLPANDFLVADKTAWM